MNAPQSAESVLPRTGSRGNRSSSLLQRAAVTSCIDGLAVFSGTPTSDLVIVTGGTCSGKTSFGSLLRSEATRTNVPFSVPTISCGWGDKNVLLGGLDALQSAASGQRSPLDCPTARSESLLHFIDDIDRLHDVHIRRVLSLVRRARDGGFHLSVVGTAASIPRSLVACDDIRIVSQPPSTLVSPDEVLDIRVFELEPLSLEDTRELALQSDASPLTAADATLLHIATSGNTLLMSEALRDPGFAESAIATVRGDSRATAQDLLRASVIGRVSSLSNSEERTLKLVSLGPGVDERIVASVLDIGENDAGAILRRLRDACLVRLASGGKEWVLHDAAVTLYVESVSHADARCREHARAADAFLEMNSGSDAFASALAAWHFNAAGRRREAAQHACASLSRMVERGKHAVVESLVGIIEREAVDESSDGAVLAESLAEAAGSALHAGNAATARRLSAVGLSLFESGRMSSDELELELLWRRARGEALSGGVERAAITLRRAQTMPLARRSGKWQARLLTVWCIVHQVRGEFDAIHKAATRALEFAEPAGDENLVGLCCNAVGNAYHALCEWSEARRWYERSARAAEDAGHDGGALVNRFNVALVDFSMGRWDDAGAELARVLDAAVELGHAYVQELAGNIMGLVLLGRGDLDAARDSLRAGMAASRECGDEWGLALSYSNQGALERECGRPLDATRLFERARHLMDRVGSRDDLPELLHRRAEVHLDLGRPDEARRLASEGRELAHGFRNRLEEWNCTRVLAQVAALEGKYDEAYDLASRAVDGLSSIGSKFEEAQALRVRGEAERLLGRLEDSARSARASLDIFTELSARREAKRTQDLLSSLSEPAVASHASRVLEPGRLATLCRSSTVLASARTVAAVARETADLAATEIPVDIAAVFAEAGGHKESALSEFCTAAGQTAVANEAKSLCESLDGSSDGAVLFDASDGEALPDPKTVDRVRSALVVPLRARDHAFGHIYLDYRDRDTTFTDDDIRFAEALAAQAATALENIELRSQLEEEIETLRWEVDGRYSFSNIIGRSVEMQKVFSLLERVSTSSATVLVEGESGTGKELVARAIHHNSRRKHERFIPQNCAALPEQLLESELFGHVRGAFTGALKEKRGLFEAADGGTFFLDEIADMPPSLQVKLLRVLQDGEIRRVGATDSISVDVRIIAATNKSLEEEVKAGRFRQDLFYRLNVVRIEMPPLRIRRDDIPLLAQHFLDASAAESGKDIAGFTDGAMQRLVNYDWPGNVRELENEMQRAVALARGDDAVGEADLSERIRQCEVTVQPPKHGAGLDLKGMVEDIERRVILQMLEQYGWNKSKTAEALGLSRQGLLKKIARLKLQRPTE